MKIVQLHHKPARRAPMVAVRRARALAGIGLADDCNASPASPRHVLLVGAPALTGLGVTAGELRANVVIDADIDALPSGTVLRAGAVRIRLTLPCESCKRLDDVRRGLAAEARGRRGMLARIIASGELAIGERVAIEPEALPALDDHWQARVVDIVRQLPAGQCVTFARLAEVAGLQSSYCRAFPALFRRLAGTGLPFDRVVTGQPARSWDGASYYRAAEGATSCRAARS